MSLSITETEFADFLVLNIVGELDLSNVPKLSDALQRSTREAWTMIVVDLDGITVLDDTALGTLLATSARLESRGSRLVVVCSNPAIRTHLRSTKLDSIVDVRDSISTRSPSDSP